jgi:hypothetical protein
MCIPPQQPSSNPPMSNSSLPMSDSEMTPDGSEPLLINKGGLKPEAPEGYVARYVDGRWRFIIDPSWREDAGDGPLDLDHPTGGPTTLGSKWNPTTGTSWGSSGGSNANRLTTSGGGK